MNSVVSWLVFRACKFCVSFIHALVALFIFKFQMQNFYSVDFQKGPLTFFLVLSLGCDLPTRCDLNPGHGTRNYAGRTWSQFVFCE